ncbi:hypothetical protein [Bradyrhizobium sp. McL0615]|uniref:hypothetical protein n=1 Tax=Bradyrhizobium sp. McL0615 TaxID=3415673 RepID=UPI003CFB1516
MHPPVMNPRHEKEREAKKAPAKPKPTRSAEARRIVEDYAKDLRAIIKKLRKRLH